MAARCHRSEEHSLCYKMGSFARSMSELDEKSSLVTDGKGYSECNICVRLTRKAGVTGSASWMRWSLIFMADRS